MTNPDPERNDLDGTLPRRTRAPFGKPLQGGGSVGKMAFVGILVGVLLIPMGMIESLISGREYSGTSAEQEVAGKWGGNQQITGPILTVPFRVINQPVKGKTDTSIGYAHFLPERLEISGSLEPEIRHRGIYDVALFKANLRLTGRFARPDFSGWRVAPGNILWDAAFVTLAVPDVRALAGDLPLTWNGKATQCLPDNFEGSPVPSALHAPVDMEPHADGKNGFAFEMGLALNGSGSMQFLPMGKETRVSIASSWKSPSFSGAFLPRENRVDAHGFSANWATFQLSRSFPQSWRGSEVSAADWNPYAFGVDLKLPVDRYQKTMRCAKYAVLFIVLTFLIFFMNETFDRRSIHPLQYVLVGCALCLFYLLLLAFTEQVPFGFAYAIATAGIVGMITAYGAAVLSTRKRAYALGGMLACLYAYLYSLLQMEDFSLLMGSLGLFAILAAVMFLTRKLNAAVSAGPAPEAA